MKKLCFLFILLHTISSLGAQEKVRVAGNRFLDTDGKTIIFRGVNTSDPDKLAREGHWNNEYFKVISEWGANVVRFPVHPRAWRNRTPENYLDLIDTGVRLADKYNLLVVIDWHSIGNLLEQGILSRFGPLYDV